MHVDTGTIENQFYRAAFDLWTGAMTSLELKSTSEPWQVLADRPGEHCGLRTGRRRSMGTLWDLEWRQAYRDDSSHWPPRT